MFGRDLPTTATGHPQKVKPSPVAETTISRDGRLSTYDENVLKLSKVSFRGKCARTGHPLKRPSPTKIARLGHFPPACQAGMQPCRPGVLCNIFSLETTKDPSYVTAPISASAPSPWQRQHRRNQPSFTSAHGVTKRCRQSWLTNSALV